MTKRIAEASPRSLARMAGVFQLLEAITAAFGQVIVLDRLVVSGNAAATATNILAHEPSYLLGWAFNLLATVCYIVVTALFYELFKPVSRSLALTAAFFSLVGCAIGGVSSVFQLAPLAVLKSAPYLNVFKAEQLQALAYTLLRLNGGNVSLIFFGFYCLLIGWLIIKSAFLPRILGLGMVIAGLGWLTFLWPPLANDLSPYNLAPGILGEGTLTLWLLVMGVNAERWKEQASAASLYEPS